MTIMFNEIYIIEEMLPIHIYIYIYNLLYREIVDIGKSDKMIKISGKVV